MTSSTVQTAVPFLLDRTFPPQMAGEFARTLEDSGVVDDFQSWDQLVSWFTNALWRPENTPLAEVMKDSDSFHDAFLLAAYATAATQRLGVAVSTDAIRRGPGELMQAMLTLAAATEGRAALMIGAGELKQSKPFGYRRSEGLARLEDHLRICRLLLECEEPFDFDGNHWTYRQAWIGTARPRRPQIWALGGGPKLRELSAKYADGFSTGVPSAYATPEGFSLEVTRMKHLLEDHGRNPDDFTFGIWVAALVHDDPDVIESAVNNPIVKYMSAAFGRFDQAKWEVEGIEAVYPRDWHYAMKLLPAQETHEAVESIVAKVPAEMCRRSWYCGSPKEVAARIQPFIDAGATWVSIGDLMPLFVPLDEAQAAIDRQIEVCRILKQG